MDTYLPNIHQPSGISIFLEDTLGLQLFPTVYIAWSRRGSFALTADNWFLLFWHLISKLLPRSFEIDLHSIIWCTGAPTSRKLYIGLSAKHRGRCQPPGVDKKVAYKACNWSSSPSLWIETAATGPSFFEAAKRLGRLDNCIQSVHGPTGGGSELVFSNPIQGGLRGHPYKALQCKSQRWKRGSAFSVKVVKHWNKLPASFVTTPLANAFKKMWDQVWIEVFSHFPL